MKLLSTYYTQEVESWLFSNPGRPITVFQIAQLFGVAYSKSATSLVARNGFKKTGIYPFNRGIFSDVDFLPSNTGTPIPSATSALPHQALPSTSALPHQALTFTPALPHQVLPCTSALPHQTLPSTSALPH